MNEITGFVVVILAAGESKRFGSPKQLANWQGQPLLLSVIKKVLSCGHKPYVALGANSDVILSNEVLGPFLDRVIMIGKWSEGLSHSIIESIDFVDHENIKGIAFILADQPLIEIDFFNEFFVNIKTSPEKLLCTSYAMLGGGLGVPAYFPKSSFNVLKELKGDQGAKNILHASEANVLNYQGGLIDIDEPEDLVRARHYFKS